MLSRLDEIIYPNRCEVIEIVPSQRYFYPIYKNGSSSIKDYAKLQQYKILLNKQIERIDQIDVVIRNPVERYLSGIKTFVYNTKRDNPELDENTILWFSEQYLFLNRHYAPQISWLEHLAGYIRLDTKLKLVGMESLSDYTPLNNKPPENIYFTDKIKERLSNNTHNEMYLRLDNCLVDLIGQKLTYIEILEYIRNKDPHAYVKLS